MSDDIHMSPAAEKELKKLAKSDRPAHKVVCELIRKTLTGEGKILHGSNALAKHRALRQGKLRVVYMPGPVPEVVYVGYRRDVYHTHCDN
jgi:mRNA-degrading endonuclease RelE of RelBE toxin-antitoxin system